MSVRIEEKPWGRIFVDEETGEQTAAIIKDRYQYILDEDFSLEGDSLAGSHFHVVVGEEIIWQGAIVGEVGPGRYLVYIDKLEDGVEHVQRVFSLDAIMGVGEEGKRLLEGAYSDTKAPVVDPYIEWRFFDSQDKAREAWLSWLDRTGRAREQT